LCGALAARITEPAARAEFLAQMPRPAAAATNQPAVSAATRNRRSPEATTRPQRDPAVVPAPTARRSSAGAWTEGTAKVGVVGGNRQVAAPHGSPSASRPSGGLAGSLHTASVGSVALLLRVCWLVTTAVAFVFLFGAFAALAYQGTQWLQHNYWPDLRFAQFWYWVKIDPEPIARFVGPRNLSWLLQLPLWVGLLTPGVVVSLISGKCGRLLRRTLASR